MEAQGAPQADIQEYLDSFKGKKQIQGPAPVDISFGEKVGGFLAPTATESFKKLKAGEGLSGRDILGSALEIGSLAIPAGAVARGVGFIGKGLNLAKKGLGKKTLEAGAVGAASGAMGGAGREIGAGGDIGDITGSTIGGAVAGGLFGGAIPGAVQAAKAIPKIVPGIKETAQKAPENIMNRVARLKPTDAQKFEKLAGETHGSYLSKTGNLGTPDEIIKKEAEKFATSKSSVDDTLAKLKGRYKVGIIRDTLAELQAKAKSVSTKNVKSPYYKEVSDLIKSYNKNGLSMSEINSVKRLYEKNVKLGYNKLLNAKEVEKATNIDNALREWQVKKASELGFKNIKELNKQTQLSKFIIDKLGDQIIGSNALNSVNLTDWIVLSGGNPTAVGAFLTKKFFSSKAVQSKLAEYLKQGEARGLIEPVLKTTRTKRR